VSNERPGIGLAIVLGVVQGPAELLPISSSAHIALVGGFAGPGWQRLDPELAKSFEVALHAGAGVALAVGQRRRIASELRTAELRRFRLIALSFLPPAVAGLAAERAIEQRLRSPQAMAGGLAAGAIGLWLADRRPRDRGPGEAGDLDGLLLGLAQAAALVPGVSRGGATLTAARARRFRREEAHLLSRSVALPVIAGAALLKGARLHRRGIDSRTRLALGAGTLAAFCSTLASQRLLSLTERERALWPFAAYRLVLAAALLARQPPALASGG